MATQGLTTIRSSHGPQDPMNRLEAAVQAKGMTVFARIDYAAGAAVSLRPTELLIFGNAKACTPLMQAVQTIGIDLPRKALVWQDASGHTWLSYNDSVWVAQRHRLSAETQAALGIMTAALKGGSESRDRRVTKTSPFSGGSRRQKNRHHFICPSNFAAPLPGLDKRLSASRPPAA